MPIAVTDTTRTWDPKRLAMNAEAATTVEQACAGRPSVLECKLDGIRLLAHIATDGIHLYTRNGNEKARHLEHVCEELAASRLPIGTWLDGEAVVMGVGDDGHFRIEWGKAQSVIGGNPKPRAVQEQVSYCLFDMMAHGSIDARPLPFCKRRELLDRAYSDEGFHAITLVAQCEATDENHETLLALGFEGSMVKWLSAPYRSNGRGMGQFKIKGQDSCEGIVMGFKPGKNSFTGYIGSLIFGQYDADGKLVERGACSGMDWPTRVSMTENIDALIAGRAIIEVTHNGVMPSGGLRHPRFIRFRDDKAPEEVTIHDA